MPLPTAEQIRPIVLRQVSGTFADPLLDLLIATADEVAARICLFPVADDESVPTMESAEYTLYPLPSRQDPRRMDLQLRPSTAVSAAEVDTTGDWTYAQDVSDDVSIEQRGRVRLNPTSTFAWSTVARGNRVTVTAGYDVAATPGLVLAYGLLAAYWLQQPPAGLQSATLVGQIATWAEARVPPQVRELLDPHRLVERETHGVVA